MQWPTPDAVVWLPRTKLLPPQVGDEVVLEPGLLRAVTAAAQSCTLTVVQAPGGCGKTTLAVAVVAAETRPVAWISLDESDDATTLLCLLVHAVDQAVPGGCPGGTELLRADLPGAYDVRRVVGALVNDMLAAGAPPLLLVLDDLHAVADTTALEAVQYLLERALGNTASGPLPDQSPSGARGGDERLATRA